MDCVCDHCGKENLERFVEVNLRHWYSGEYHMYDYHSICLFCAKSPGLEMIAWEMVRND